MRDKLTRRLILALAALLPLGAAAADRVDGDIEKLKAEIWYSANQWHVGVRYEVKIKHPPPNGAFLLRVSFTDDGRPALDSKGRVIVIDVPLENARYDDKKLYFEDVMTVDLPQATFQRGDKVKVRAQLLMEGHPEVLDKTDARAKVRYEPPWEPPR
jgi:hypothetical protein